MSPAFESGPSEWKFLMANDLSPLASLRAWGDVEDPLQAEHELRGVVAAVDDRQRGCASPGRPNPQPASRRSQASLNSGRLAGQESVAAADSV
jgi:hypothetical protein